MFTFGETIVVIIIVYICVYSIVVRICKCLEKNTINKSFSSMKADELQKMMSIIQYEQQKIEKMERKQKDE